MELARLKTTQLGGTGLEITRVGFGAWAIGGGGWELGDAVVDAARLELSDADLADIEGAWGTGDRG